jgi:hypothetical protein
MCMCVCVRVCVSVCLPVCGFVCVRETERGCETTAADTITSMPVSNEVRESGYQADIMLYTIIKCIMS